MHIKIVIAVLVATLEGATPIKSQPPPADFNVNQSAATIHHVKDFENTFSLLTRPAAPAPVANYRDGDLTLHEVSPLLGGRSHPRKRRDVPASSYSRTGQGGVTAFKPGEETINSDGSFSKDFKTEDGISSSMSGYQKPLWAGEQGQAMEGRFSYKAPDGSTVDTTWTADERGFVVQGPHLPVFQLGGLGRRR